MGKSNHRKANHRKSSADIENYVKTQMEENHEEGEKFHYNNSDYNGVLWHARVSGFNSLSSFTLEGICYLYMLSVG